MKRPSHQGFSFIKENLSAKNKDISFSIGVTKILIANS